MSDQPLMTIDECAAFLRISVRTLRRHVAARKIPVVRINKRVWRFNRETILAKLK